MIANEQSNGVSVTNLLRMFGRTSRLLVRRSCGLMLLVVVLMGCTAVGTAGDPFSSGSAPRRASGGGGARRPVHRSSDRTGNARRAGRSAHDLSRSCRARGPTLARFRGDRGGSVRPRPTGLAGGARGAALGAGRAVQSAPG